MTKGYIKKKNSQKDFDKNVSKLGETASEEDQNICKLAK